MKKYLLLELFFILTFITSVKIYRGFFLQTGYENIVIVYFSILAIITFLVLPAAIILKITEKHAPNMMPSKRWEQKSPFNFPRSKSLKAYFLSQAILWGLYFIFNKLGMANNVSAIASSLIVSLLFGFFYNMYKEKKSGKMEIKEMIFPTIVSILSFIAIVLLRQIYTYN